MIKPRTLRTRTNTLVASNTVETSLSTVHDDEEQGTTQRKWGSLLDILRDVVFAYSLYLTDHGRQVLLFIFRRTRMCGKP
jgi:hypothetical protein